MFNSLFGLTSKTASTWWHNQMETFSALLANSAWNSLVTDEFPAQRPVRQSFDVFFGLHLNEWLSKQWWGWWFEMPSCPLWRHCNESFALLSHLRGEPSVTSGFPIQRASNAEGISLPWRHHIMHIGYTFSLSFFNGCFVPSIVFPWRTSHHIYMGPVGPWKLCPMLLTYTMQDPWQLSRTCQTKSPSGQWVLKLVRQTDIVICVLWFIWVEFTHIFMVSWGFQLCTIIFLCIKIPKGAWN